MEAEVQRTQVQTGKEAMIAGYVQQHYGIQVVSATRLGGYSNENYHICCAGGKQYVARLARPNRSEESCLAEAHVLAHLQYRQPALAPVLLQPFPGRFPVSVNSNETWQYLHLFHKIPGAIDCLWWQQCSIEKLELLFDQLAVLHQQLQLVPALQNQAHHMRIHTLPATAPVGLSGTATGRYVIRQWDRFIGGAKLLQQDVQAAFPWKEAAYQWIHGDVQLENVLFDGDRLTAFLDFEWVSWDACEKDVIFSAFRTCKEGPSDDRFRFDETRLQVALEAYRKRNGLLCGAFFAHYHALWKPFFCLDQTMMYLQNAAAGVWELAEGIGFLPCFDEVVKYKCT